MWVEVSFNILYLVVIWALVAAMFVRRNQVAPENQQVARLFRWAFFLLALGDTGHVGFRVIDYADGSLGGTMALFGRPVNMVGLGALATAITVTFFYVLVLMIWQAPITSHMAGSVPCSSRPRPYGCC
ncbi:MAG: hypothetical protein IPK16_27150 [Anaerolineales bacterium]|nr:hypothetical protein [Anaerolineales bacterium]